MNLDDLDVMPHANGWHRPFPNKEASDSFSWCVRQDPTNPDPATKGLMVALFELVGIRSQYNWDEGRDTKAYIKLLP